MPGSAVKRIQFSLLLGIIIGGVLSEVSFLLLRETSRAPKTILLVIPVGTAEQIVNGEAPPDIPKSMTFVVGDTLVIRNDDSVQHQMGPLWIPAGASAQLSLTAEENLAYECSFQPGNTFGLDVHQPVTIWTRLYGILFAGIPLGVLIAIYSFVMPSNKSKGK